MTEHAFFCRRLIQAFLLILAAFPALAEHAPSARTGKIDYQFSINLSREYGMLAPLAEIAGRIEEKDFRYRALRAGAYLELNRNLKIGGFYTLLSGAWRFRTWSTSKDVSNARESGYRVQDRGFILGTGLILRF